MIRGISCVLLQVELLEKKVIFIHYLVLNDNIYFLQTFAENNLVKFQRVYLLNPASIVLYSLFSICGAHRPQLSVAFPFIFTALSDTSFPPTERATYSFCSIYQLTMRFPHALSTTSAHLDL